MTMDPMEIAVEFRTAAHPGRQLRILAELNSCSVDKIVEILENQGEKIDRRWLPRKKAAPITAENQEEVMEKKTEADARVDPVPAEQQLEVVPKDELVSIGDALPALIRSAAIDAIAQLLSRMTPPSLPFQGARTLDDAGQTSFAEQVRGVLALVHEVEQRCQDMPERGEG